MYCYVKGNSISLNDPTRLISYDITTVVNATCKGCGGVYFDVNHKFANITGVGGPGIYSIGFMVQKVCMTKATIKCDKEPDECRYKCKLGPLEVCHVCFWEILGDEIGADPSKPIHESIQWTDAGLGMLDNIHFGYRDAYGEITDPLDEPCHSIGFAVATSDVRVLASTP